MASGNRRAQSAMEYLMTYGWAILLIAIAVVVLFQLGLFNYNGLTQKAQSGSCSVFRPHGPGTSALIQTIGVCSNMIPQSVLQISKASNTFTINSHKSFFDYIPNATFAIWVKPSTAAIGQLYQEGASAPGANGCPTMLVAGNPILIDVWNTHTAGNWLAWTTSANLEQGYWQYVVYTLNDGKSNAGTGKIYINGTLEGTTTTQAQAMNTSQSEQSMTGAAGTGCPGVYTGSFNGSIANLQIYNTTLNANQIRGLYTAGIGADPVQIQNLVAWYPYNNDLNDYSGNKHNATSGGSNTVQFTSNWQSGYAIP